MPTMRPMPARIVPVCSITSTAPPMKNTIDIITADWIMPLVTALKMSHSPWGLLAT